MFPFLSDLFSVENCCLVFDNRLTCHSFSLQVPCKGHTVDLFVRWIVTLFPVPALCIGQGENSTKQGKRSMFSDSETSDDESPKHSLHPGDIVLWHKGIFSDPHCLKWATVTFIEDNGVSKCNKGQIRLETFDGIGFLDKMFGVIIP